MGKYTIEQLATARPMDDTGDYLVLLATEIISLKKRLSVLENKGLPEGIEVRHP